MTISYLEIKHPLAHLRKGEHSSVVFAEISEDEVISWDDIPDNYPRWTLATHSKQEATKRILKMIDDEGWRLVETTVDEWKQLCWVE